MRQNNGLGTDQAENFRASIPLFAISRSPQRDSTSVLWPLFAWIDDRDKKYHEWQGPWPFVIFTRGEGKHTSRVWPLFSQSHNATKENDSYLWPLYIYTRTHSEPLDQRRSRVLFYLYSRLAVKNTETGKERIRLDMWPFFTWHHEFNGNERLQILAPLEPVVPDNPGVERNWSPLWSLWRAEKNPATGAAASRSCGICIAARPPGANRSFVPVWPSWISGARRRKSRSRFLFASTPSACEVTAVAEGWSGTMRPIINVPVGE